MVTSDRLEIRQQKQSVNNRIRGRESLAQFRLMLYFKMTVIIMVNILLEHGIYVDLIVLLIMIILSLKGQL